MALLVRFPKVATNVEEGMVGAWRKREGDRVARDEALVELITDKATFELTAEQDGVLLRILAAEKSTVPTHYIVAIIGSRGETAPDVARENELLLAAYRARSSAKWGATPEGAETAPAAQRVRATPAARRLARDNNIDLAKVKPADGQIVRDDDVMKYMNEKS